MAEGLVEDLVEGLVEGLEAISHLPIRQLQVLLVILRPWAAL